MFRMKYVLKNAAKITKTALCHANQLKISDELREEYLGHINSLDPNSDFMKKV